MSDKIIQSVLRDFNSTPSVEEIEKPEEKTFCNAITNKSKFFRETANVTLQVLMMVLKWCDFAAKKKNQQPQTKSFDRIFPKIIICFIYAYLRCFILK